MYECHAISRAYQCLASHFTYDNKNVMHCDCTQNSHDLFGCAGINQGAYCILNKQYFRDEYEELVPTIIRHMQKTGEFGQFFPIVFSPFGYNQSRAQEYYPRTKDRAEAQGIPWSSYEPPAPEADSLIAAADLPDSIADVSDDILRSAILCEVSGKPFRMIKQELEFYRSNGLPLPRRHPDQRYKDRFDQRPPRRLWKRTCQKCGNGIETAYAPDHSEIVYCERCYLETVY
jgi:hypothetical protein